MPYIDFDMEDILWNMSESETQELVDSLYEDGYVPSQITESKSDITDIIDTSELNIIELEWVQMIDKLKQIRLSISNEDVDKINEILKRY